METREVVVDRIGTTVPTTTEATAQATAVKITVAITVMTVAEVARKRQLLAQQIVVKVVPGHVHRHEETTLGQGMVHVRVVNNQLQRVLLKRKERIREGNFGNVFLVTSGWVGVMNKERRMENGAEVGVVVEEQRELDVEYKTKQNERSRSYRYRVYLCVLASDTHPHIHDMNILHENVVGGNVSCHVCTVCSTSVVVVVRFEGNVCHV